MISTNETMTNIKSGIMQKQTPLQRADGEITTLIDFDFTKRMATINCNYRNKYTHLDTLKQITSGGESYQVNNS